MPECSIVHPTDSKEYFSMLGNTSQHLELPYCFRHDINLLCPYNSV